MSDRAPVEGRDPLAAPSPLPQPAAVVAIAVPSLTLAMRGLLLFSLLGAAIVLLAEYTVHGSWVSAFIRSNELPADQRVVLFVSIAGGAALGIVTAAILLFLAWRRRLGFEGVVRLGWFLSPLACTAFLPLLLKPDIWDKKALWLLVSTGLVAFLFEGAFARALRDVPEAIRRTWSRIGDRLQNAGRVLPGVVVGLGSVGYAMFMAFFTVRRHHNLQTANFDAAIQNQLMASALEGKFLESPVCMGKDGASFLTNHAQFGMHVFLPIYALNPRIETLMGIEALLLGASAIPLFLFARRRVSPWQAAIIALCYLAYYPMHGANFYEVQYIPIGATFVMWTVWAVDAGRWKSFAVLFALALSMREDTSIGLAIVGTFLVFSGHRPRAGLVMIVVSVAYFAFMRFYLMPLAGNWWFHNMYKSLCPEGEKGFACVIRTIVSNPLYVLSHLMTEKKLLYTLHLFTPLAFLPLRRSYLWLGFIPGIIPTILTTDYDPTIKLGFQYSMAWTPYLFLAVPLAVASLAKLGAHRAGGALAGMAFATAVLTYNFGAFATRPTFVSGFGTVRFEWTPEAQTRLDDLRAMADLIPRYASVAASSTAGPHVSSRHDMYNFEKGPQGAEYIFVRKADLGKKTKERLQTVLRDNSYGVLARQGEFTVLKRKHSTAGNAKLKTDWRL